MAKKVVILSGGLDSLVTLAIALKDNKCRKKDLYVFRVDLGSKQSKKESTAFSLIADYYGIPVENRCEAAISMPSWMGNDLFDPDIISVQPDDEFKDFFISEESKSTIGDKCDKILVPIRNAVLLSMAFSYSLSIGADSLWAGFDYVDSPGNWWDNAPPDKHPDFVSLMSQALNKASGKSPVSLEMPLQGKDKRWIVKKGHELNAPYELSWSCYNGFFLPCGICPACTIRLKGFKSNDICDPSLYLNKSEILKYLHNSIP